MELDGLSGAAEVIRWFGYMPSFHDAEVIEISLRRHGESLVSVHCWHMTNELDEHGAFVLSKHAVVTFRLTGITDLSLGEFNDQNVIFGLNVTTVDGGLELELHPSFGVGGTITAQKIWMELRAGKPS